MNEPVIRIESRFVSVPSDNIDTDQICPARFLTTTSRDGFARALFAEWRFDERGDPRPEFPLNRPDAAGARVLVAGRNFGCGSSREHAVWAIRENGISAVIAPSFADIFRRNALKNGLVPAAVDPAAREAILAAGGPVVVDVSRCVVSWKGGEAPFPLEPFARQCLLEGVDELGYLLARRTLIEAHEAAHADR